MAIAVPGISVISDGTLIRVTFEKEKFDGKVIASNFPFRIFLVIGETDCRRNFLINVNLFKISSGVFSSLSLSKSLVFKYILFIFNGDNVDFIHRYFIRSDLTIFNGPLLYLTSLSEKCLKFLLTWRNLVHKRTAKNQSNYRVGCAD